MTKLRLNQEFGGGAATALGNRNKSFLRSIVSVIDPITGIRKEDVMASDNRDDGISRRHALECMVWVGTAVLWNVSGGVPQSLSLLDGAQAAVAIAQTKPTIAVIVKDTTSLYWQTVLAGARKAGQDFGVEIAELGAQSESDADGQITLLENAVSSNPAAVVIAPAHSVALGRQIDAAAKRAKVVAIDSTADSKALTSVLATDNTQAGRI